MKKTLLKQTLINLLMVEVVILLAALNVAIKLPMQLSGGLFPTFLLVYLFAFATSLIPALLISFVFASWFDGKK